jgi:hypothetical protein
MEVHRWNSIPGLCRDISQAATARARVDLAPKMLNNYCQPVHASRGRLQMKEIAGNQSALVAVLQT